MSAVPSSNMGHTVPTVPTATEGGAGQPQPAPQQNHQHALLSFEQFCRAYAQFRGSQTQSPVNPISSAVSNVAEWEIRQLQPVQQQHLSPQPQTLPWTNQEEVIRAYTQFQLTHPGVNQNVSNTSVVPHLPQFSSQFSPSFPSVQNSWTLEQLWHLQRRNEELATTLSTVCMRLETATQVITNLFNEQNEIKKLLSELKIKHLNASEQNYTEQQKISSNDNNANHNISSSTKIISHVSTSLKETSATEEENPGALKKRKIEKIDSHNSSPQERSRASSAVDKKDEPHFKQPERIIKSSHRTENDFHKDRQNSTSTRRSSVLKDENLEKRKVEKIDKKDSCNSRPYKKSKFSHFISTASQQNDEGESPKREKAIKDTDEIGDSSQKEQQDSTSTGKNSILEVPEKAKSPNATAADQNLTGERNPEGAVVAEKVDEFIASLRPHKEHFTPNNSVNAGKNRDTKENDRKFDAEEKYLFDKMMTEASEEREKDLHENREFIQTYSRDFHLSKKVCKYGSHCTELGNPIHKDRFLHPCRFTLQACRFNDDPMHLRKFTHY